MNYYIDLENRGLVSIIMPLYNYGRFLEASVSSVLSQTYPSWELLIIDDCSTDDSFDIASRLAGKDTRIKTFKLDKNGGTSAARNKGLDEAKGEFIAFLDSDDQYDPNYLDSQLSNFEKTGCDISVASYRRKAPNSLTDFIVPDEITFKSILKGNPMAPLGTMFRWEKFKSLRFREDMRKCEDYVFFLEMLKSGGIAKPNKNVLGTLNIHEDSKSRNKKALIKWQLLSYKKAGINWFARWYYLFCWAVYGLNKYRSVK